MKRIAKKRILKIKPYQPGRPIDEVKRDLGLKDVIKLASNENPYGPSPKVLKAMLKESQTVNRYPDGGCFYLRRELAKKLKVKKEQLIFGNGSDEIIVCALRGFVEVGDEVIIAKPSFLIYDIASRVVGAKVRAIPLKGLQYDLEGMLKAVTRKTKLIFIGNPDNPSGQYISKVKLERFLKRLRKNVLVFIDEAYFEYVTEKDYPDSVKLLKKHKNIIVTRTFSKIYGLAGLRVGYGVAHNEVIDILERVREPFNVNSIAQSAALACLKEMDYYKRLVKRVDSQRQWLYRSLEALNIEYVKTYTNFVLVDLKKKSTPIVSALLKKGIIVRDMKVWGLNTFLRASIGTEKENKRLIGALRTILKEAKK